MVRGIKFVICINEAHKKFNNFLCASLILFIYASCTEKPDLAPSQPQTIIFLGHIYQESNRIDPRLEKINFKKYDQIWLGGDICSETTEKKSTLKYLDRMFDLDHPGTHWAKGNHDVRNGNLEWFQEYTGRDLFYFQQMVKLGMLVLNTNLEEDCLQLNEQFELIESLPVTASGLSHLIVMTHHVIWGESIHGVNMWETANANRPSWQVRCEPAGDFQSAILPVLENIQQSGIQVICLAGDFGQRVKQFSYLANNGIWFLGAGMNKGLSLDLDPEDSVIRLNYDPEGEKLDWEFLTIDELAEEK